MKKIIPLLLGTLALQLSAAAHSSNVMAVVKSNSGTTTIQTTLNEKATFKVSQLYYWFDNKVHDFLAPAKAGAPKLEVKPGYCAITSNAEHFNGSKINVWGPGNHDVKAKTGSGIYSLAVYWNGTKPCQPEYDFPMVLSADRTKYQPLFDTWDSSHVFTNRYSEEDVDTAVSFFESVLTDSIVTINGKLYINKDVRGFSDVAKRLTVPTCHHSIEVGDAEWETYRDDYNAGDHLLDKVFSNVFFARYHERYMRRADCKMPSTIQRSAKGGLIRHNGNNLCLNPEGGGVPSYDTRAVLTSNCSATDPGNKFRMLFDGTIQHVESGMCLHPRGGSSTPGNGTELVFWPSCGANTGAAGAYIRFENTLKNSLRQLSSGKCLHPNGGSAKPANGTKVVFWQGCNEDRLRFSFDAQ